MMESEDNFFNKKLVKGGKRKVNKNPKAAVCCCCSCPSPTPMENDNSCFLCIPIRLGVTFIGAIILSAAIIDTTAIYLLTYNDYYDWWFGTVTFVLIIPLIVAAAFAITFFARDTPITRQLMVVACILTLISAFLIAAW